MPRPTEGHLLNLLERVMIIWDREGVGSDESESEPLHNDILTALSLSGRARRPA